MNEIFAASAAAAWFGFLSSISPCTLAANLAAVTFAGRKVGPVRAAVLSGLLYSAGRTASCSLLGFGLVSGILNAPELSHLLQKYMNLLMAPLLVVAAMILLDLLSFAAHGRGLAGKFQNIAERLGIWGAFAFGVIFALSFCPASAVLFFGSLLPLAVRFSPQSCFQPCSGSPPDSLCWPWPSSWASAQTGSGAHITNLQNSNSGLSV